MNQNQGRPATNDQRAWNVYEEKVNSRLKQQWLFTPFLNPTRGRPTQPLAGCDESDLFKVRKGGEVMEHYTNIRRMRA